MTSVTCLLGIFHRIFVHCILAEVDAGPELEAHLEVIQAGFGLHLDRLQHLDVVIDLYSSPPVLRFVEPRKGLGAEDEVNRGMVVVVHCALAAVTSLPSTFFFTLGFMLGVGSFEYS